MEERRADREVINRYLKVYDDQSDRFIGYLVDITPRGAMLQSNEPIDPDRDFKLRVELPEQMDGSERICVAARSVWDKKETNALFYHTGFQFRDPSPEEENKIQQLMQSYRLDQA